jgi:hypothetical protein
MHVELSVRPRVVMRITEFYARPGIIYRPVTDIIPSQVGVAWAPAADSNPIVQDFVRCCLDSRPPQHDQTSS